jgi:hypothetical protein
MTLGSHILESQRHHPRARGELSTILMQLAFTLDHGIGELLLTHPDRRDVGGLDP